MTMKNTNGFYTAFLPEKKMNAMEYVELQATSNFSFLRGGSHPEELIEEAAACGYKAIAITDRNSMAGIVRAHAAAKGYPIRLIPACRLDLQDGPSLLAYPTSKEAYGRLCALLTKGNLRAEKGKCTLYKADVYRYTQGIIFIVVPPDSLNASFDFEEVFKKAVKEYRDKLAVPLYIAANRTYQANDMKRLHRLAQLSEELRVPLVATNDVHYHTFERRQLQDILTCTREKKTIYNAGFLLHQNAERYLKHVKEMHRLFAHFPDAINRALEIADACKFSLAELKYVYPKELIPDGLSPNEYLAQLTIRGAEQMFGKDIPKKIRATIDYELEFITRKDYASYFLTVWDYVSFARSRGILCQGRGSAANSVVCYCLGITSVNPSKFRLLFARFMSDARDEPPDVDVDFEHERREEVIQYIYERFGRHRAAIVATVTQVHAKGAIRDVGKAMGLSVDAVGRLSKCISSYSEEWFDPERLAAEGFNPDDPHLQKVLELTHQYLGFPRQLGQHTGGFVITEGKITDLCPVVNARMENRTNVEWNKDDIEALGFLKVDVLALGMLTCIRKAFDLARQHYGKEFTLANIPQDDEAVYDMITAADTIGVFQIESRAQMSMLPRLKPKCFYDLVIEVAIVRPGPIQGDMVHPYLRRRNGQEPVEYPSKELEEILGRTLGVPLFQEQAMEIAIVAAGFTPAEADQLRRSMATFKAKGLVGQFRNKLVEGMKKKGYTEEFALRVFKQLEGFGSYGFPESHAASFALLVYISSWIKCYYPDIFACALLNSQPMGFYQPAQIVIDARKHGVEVRPVDINFSCWDNILEEQAGNYRALRLGFRQVRGIRQDDMEKLVTARIKPYTNIGSVSDAGVPLSALERLADADAFRSIGLDRRRALWEVTALTDKPVGIFTGHTAPPEEEVGIALPELKPGEHVVQDYNSMALSLKAHPVSFIRSKLAEYGITPNAQLGQLQDGSIVRVAGLVLVRQRPGTASGICFVTIEDETASANLVVFRKLFDRYRREVVRSRLLMVEGKLQKEGNVIHVVAQKCWDVSNFLFDLTSSVPTIPADKDGKAGSPQPVKQADPCKEVVQLEMFPSGRNFK